MADEKDYLGDNERLDSLERSIEKTLDNVNTLIEINKKILQFLLDQKGQKNG